MCGPFEAPKKIVTDREKPRWDDAPEWANWIAQDDTGTWFWYASEPIKASACWVAGVGRYAIAERTGLHAPRWYDSLEQRSSHTTLEQTVPAACGDGVDATLRERGARYGAFRDHAVIAQRLQDEMRSAPGWARLAPDQRQALTVIADKIARILNGDPGYIDNWHDLQGYARLVEDRLREESTNG